MAKNTKTGKQQEIVTPRFHPLTVVSTPSLVVDVNGVAWWVDTEHNSIRKATVLS